MGWPDLTYRSRLEPQLRNELDQLVSLIIGWNSAEHGADGQHTTITVDGIQFRHADGTIFATITVGDGGLVITYTPTSPPAVDPTIVLPTAQISDVLVGHHHGIPTGTFSHNAGIDLNTDAPPDLGGKWLLGVGRDALADAMIFANYAAAGAVGEGVALYFGNLGVGMQYALCPPAAGSTLLYALGSRLDARLRWDLIAGKQVDASLGMFSALGYYERGRGVPLGEWVDVPFSAANFFGAGAMVVTVDPTDQLTFAYTVVGRSMTIVFYIAPITISGAGGPVIFVKIPDGYLSDRYVRNGLAQCFDNGVLVPGMVRANAGGGDVLEITRQDGVPWSVSVNNTYLVGQITFSIQ